MPKWIASKQNWEDEKPRYLCTDDDLWRVLAIGVLIGALLCGAGVFIGFGH